MFPKISIKEKSMNCQTLKSSRTLLLAPLAALCLLSASAQAQTTPSTSTPQGHMPQGQMPQGQMPQGQMPQGQMPQGHMQQGGSDGMRKSMMSGMDSMQKMPMSGDTDKDFAMMMKIHHQQAVDMAQMQLDHGKAPEMKAMARQIIVAQKKEIAQFDQWLATKK